MSRKIITEKDMSKTEVEKIVKDILKKEKETFIKGKDLEDKVTEICGNVLIQYHKSLYNKRGFWSKSLKNKSI